MDITRREGIPFRKENLLSIWLRAAWNGSPLSDSNYNFTEPFENGRWSLDPSNIPAGRCPSDSPLGRSCLTDLSVARGAAPPKPFARWARIPQTSRSHPSPLLALTHPVRPLPFPSLPPPRTLSSFSAPLPPFRPSSVCRCLKLTDCDMKETFLVLRQGCCTRQSCTLGDNGVSSVQSSHQGVL